MNISDILPISQIVISVFLIAAILLQQRSAGLGSSFGGESASFSSRRGTEKQLFRISIVLGILFIVLAIIQLTL